MKKNHLKLTTLSSLLLAVLLSSTVVFAKPPHSKPDFEYWANELGLSDTQRQAFIDVMKIQHEKRKTLQSEARAERKEKMQAHKRDTLTALSDVLTEEQLIQFESIMEELKKKRIQMKKNRDMQ